MRPILDVKLIFICVVVLEAVHMWTVYNVIKGHSNRFISHDESLLFRCFVSSEAHNRAPFVLVYLSKSLLMCKISKSTPLQLTELSFIFPVTEIVWIFPYFKFNFWVNFLDQCQESIFIYNYVHLFYLI